MDYSVYRPFNSQKYFHNLCWISDYNNQTNVEDCWLGDNTVALPDLDTTSTEVKNMWYDWVESLVSNYSGNPTFTSLFSASYETKTNKYQVDGLRVDTVKNVQKNFWPGYNNASGVYCIGEVFDGDASYTCPYQEDLDGVLNYPM